MKGNPKVLEQLQTRLTAELAAHAIYLAHGALARNLWLSKLAAHYAEEAAGEQRHAEQLLDRILFLEGTPRLQVSTTSAEDPVDPMRWLERDVAVEAAAVTGYTEAATLARAEGDAATALVFEQLLLQEQEHLNEAEGTLDLVRLQGLPLWLAGVR